MFQNELLISDTHGHFAVSKASLSEEIPDELSVDSTDYDNCDSCSDYEVHLSSDEDSKWEDIMEDSGAPMFQFVDPVAEKLDAAVRSGFLDKEHIFYKLVSSALEFLSYDHSQGKKYRWDPTVVRWSRSLLQLGKSKTLNFVRGPGGFKACKETKRSQTGSTH